MADRYWVGGSGNWNTTASWSASSGGASGASIPTSADNVIFNSASSASDYTVTVNATANCLAFTASAPASGNMTLAGSSTLNIYDGTTLYSGLVVSYTGTLTYLGSAARNLTTNGCVVNCNITLNNASATLTFQDNFVGSTTTLLTLTTGHLNFNNKNVKCARLVSTGSATRTVTFGNGLINFYTVSSLTVLNFANTGLTVNANSSSILVDGTGTGARFLICGNQTLNNVTFNVPATTQIGFITSSATMNTFICSAGATLVFTAGQTYTFSSFSADGTVDNPTVILESPYGTNANIVKAGGGTVNMSRVSIREMTATPANTWYADLSQDRGGNSGITFNTAGTRYWVGGSGNWNNTSRWSNTSGGSSGFSVPSASEDVVFDSNSSASTYTVTMDILSPETKNLTVSQPASGNAIFDLSNTSVNLKIVGNATFYPGFTIVNGAATVVDFRSAVANQFLTSNGATLNCDCSFNGNPFGYKYTIQDALATTGFIRATSGSLVINNCNVTCDTYRDTGSNFNNVTFGNGVMTLTSTGAANTNTFVSNSTNTTVDGSQFTIRMAHSNANQKHVVLANSRTFKALQVYQTATGNTGAVVVNGNATFTTIEVAARNSLLFVAGVTVTTTNFLAGGYTIISSTTAAQHNLVKSGGGVVSVRQSTISQSNASPANTWYAYGSTDGGSNGGWTFGAMGSGGASGGWAGLSGLSGLTGLSSVF